MTIDKLESIDPIQKLDQIAKNSKPTSKTETDAVSLSSEARLRGELLKLSEQIQSSPDVRAERIAEIKQKLQDPHYIDDTVIDTLADRVIDMFGLS